MVNSLCSVDAVGEEIQSARTKATRFRQLLMIDLPLSYSSSSCAVESPSLQGRPLLDTRALQGRVNGATRSRADHTSCSGDNPTAPERYACSHGGNGSVNARSVAMAKDGRGGNRSEWRDMSVDMVRSANTATAAKWDIVQYTHTDIQRNTTRLAVEQGWRVTGHCLCARTYGYTQSKQNTTLVNIL
jgi:hypothetical protein